jgi:hypothetical protein
MGISQWRSREGSLFHTCAYAHWDPRPLIELLDIDEPTRAGLLADLPRSAIGVDDLAPAADLAPHPRLDPAQLSLPVLRDTLLTTFATWGKDLRPRQV